MAGKNTMAEAREVLKKIVETCRRINIRPEPILCGGSKPYYKAIKAVRNVGIQSTNLSIIGVFITIFLNFNGAHYSGIFWIVYILSILLLGNISLRLWELNGTPKTFFVYIILAVLLSVFAMPWFFSVIILMLALYAIVRFRGYKHWFDFFERQFKIFTKESILDSLEWRAMYIAGKTNLLLSAEPELKPKHTTKKKNTANPKIVKIVSILRSRGVPDIDIANAIVAVRGDVSLTKVEKQLKIITAAKDKKG